MLSFAFRVVKKLDFLFYVQTRRAIEITSLWVRRLLLLPTLNIKNKLPSTSSSLLILVLAPPGPDVAVHVPQLQRPPVGRPQGVGQHGAEAALLQHVECRGRGARGGGDRVAEDGGVEARLCVGF